MNQSNSNIFATGVYSLLGLGAAMGSATAALADDAPQFAVSYKDLDLSRHADVRTLYHRLELASINVCGEAPADRELSSRLAWNRCYHGALDPAVQKFGSSELAALNR